MIRVLVVDDQPLVRAGVIGLLSGTDGIEVVGECTDGAEVVPTAVGCRPDVVLMDVRMPLVSGPDATRELLACVPACRVLMLSASQETSAMDLSRAAGAVGFILKGGRPAALVAAIRDVAAGQVLWAGQLAT